MIDSSRTPSINRAIFALALPAIVTNITTPLLGLMDVAIVGHLGSPAFIAAIAIGGNMFNMLYWLFGFLRMGTSGITSQAYGAADPKAQSATLARSLLIAFTAGLLLILLSGPLSTIILRFIDAQGVTREYALEYFRILVFGAPAVLSTYALTGWFVGMQNSKATMWMSFFIDIANIVISLIMVFGLKLQLRGVATGTLVAQWSGFVFGMVWIMRKFRPVRVSLSEILSLADLKRFFSINADIFLRTLCLVAVTMWFTRAGAVQGTVMLAVNTLLMQFFMLFSYFMDGFAFAAEALCGRFVGASDRHSLRRAVGLIFRWGAVIATLFTLLYAVGGDMLLSVMTSEKEVINASLDYRWWTVTLPFVGFAAFLWDGVFIGATLTRWMLLSVAGATAIFFGLYVLLFDALGNHGLWIAFLSYLLVRGLILTVASRKLLKG